MSRLGVNPYASRSAGDDKADLGRIIDLKAVDRFIKLLRGREPDELAELLRRADRSVERRFELFGRVYQLGRILSWDRDFETGYQWPARFHVRYRYSELIDLDNATDVKIPWEIGRLQFLPVMMLAYRASGEERYVNAARDIFLSWSRANPVGYGVQWVVGMDVALRAISLVLSAELLDRTPVLDRFVDRRFMQILETHGRFLYRNIEYSDVNGNHHTSCLVGLFYLGLWLESAPEARLWRTRAVRGLRSEILLQTYPDGVCHEGSIPYHRLVTELFLHAFFVARRAGIDLGKDFRDRLEHMLEFVAAYTKPTGESPVWGDADDGRVHKLGFQPVNDHRYLTMIGAGLLRHQSLLPANAPLSLDTMLLLDEEAFEFILSSLENVEETEVSSQGFEQGGFFFLRAQGSYCLIDCGDIGLRGRGGHGHYDALSVEMTLKGKDVLTDTGCSDYTRSIARRRHSLSAKSHNAAVLDEREPAPLSMDRWPHANQYPVEVVQWSPGERLFVGRHYGYAALSDFDYYQRKVELAEDGTNFTISDDFRGSGVHDVRWQFHLGEDFSVVRLEAGVARLVDSTRSVSVAFRCASRSVELSLIDSPRYPTYGVERRRRCLVVTVRKSFPFSTRFEIDLT